MIEKLKEFWKKTTVYVYPHTVSIIIILEITVAILIAIFLINHSKTKPSDKVKGVVHQTTSHKLTDSLVQVYQEIKAENFQLNNQVKELITEKNTLVLKYNLIKYQFNTIKKDEKTVKYISNKNTSIESALDSITRIVKRNPINFSNK